ncbi:8-oxo-dGTP pyrophosphatase MutT (NUDIX family) [Microbacterium testaceum]|nr:8-oxo-dGTP pyrophosphatase MutT (NUDIX family) [Microbacterium sp. SORGH_AS_0969]MDQ1115565.1 8-oxo-dGTP pyrophosphatase MutT (NUDIX family) [Microbacterium testaceum]
MRSVVEDAYGDGMTNETEPGWQTLSRREAYVGRVRIVEHEVVLPDGTSSTYEVDESVPFAVATLVVEEAQVVLARQYRYPLDRWIFDLPGGAGHATETPEDAARRELEEELGLIATELVPLQTFFVNPGRAAWPVHLFLCVTETRPGVADTSDPAEQVRHARLSIGDLDAAIARGDIVDPALLIARASAAARGLLPPIAPAP